MGVTAPWAYVLAIRLGLWAHLKKGYFFWANGALSQVHSWAGKAQVRYQSPSAQSVVPV